MRLLYLVPNFQNPTGLLIGLDKRRALLEWAERADILIVEDDPYGDLYFPDSATAEETRPIKADDRDGRVVYLSSFSKTLAPGFRTAWIVAPEAIGHQVRHRQAGDRPVHAARSISASCIRQSCKGCSRTWRRGCATHYQAKRTVMQLAIEHELDGIVTCARARGGFFLWATLPPPVDADALLPRALAAAVTYVAGGAFFVDGSGGNTVRLSFSQPTHERIREGVARLAGAIRAERDAQSAPSRDERDLGAQGIGQRRGRRLDAAHQHHEDAAAGHHGDRGQRRHVGGHQLRRRRQVGLRLGLAGLRHRSAPDSAWTSAATPATTTTSPTTSGPPEGRMGSCSCHFRPPLLRSSA